MTDQAQADPSKVVKWGDQVSEAERTGDRSAGWWAMLFLIIAEAVFFASLIAGYFYLQISSPIWPQDNLKRPDMALATILTGLVVASSFFMQWGLSSIKQDRAGRLRLAWLIALLLAAGFLGLQIYGYFHSGLDPQANAYASLFFTITGLHSAHVLIAVLMNIFIQVRLMFRHFTAQRYLAVENVVLYWHFVNIVWLVIFSSLYLSTYLS